VKFTLALIVLVASAATALAQEDVKTDVTADVQAAPAYVTMTSGQRWTDFVTGNLASPAVALRALSSAAISHINREPLSYGMGSRGFFERAGSHYARFAVQGALHSGVAAALGHDTRYFREPDANGWRRAGHALRRTFVTRNREGQNVFDVSEIASLYASPMIASTWHPRPMSPLTQGFRGGNFGVGTQALGNLFREFGPDLKHLVRK
jgi:opacity protein-like surface antigen